MAIHLDDVLFKVRDTGIDIAAEHFERIFEEFGQIDHAIQSRVKGTGSFRVQGP
jgi:signal transduction histidine kinase